MPMATTSGPGGVGASVEAYSATAAPARARRAAGALSAAKRGLARPVSTTRRAPRGAAPGAQGGGDVERREARAAHADEHDAAALQRRVAERAQRRVRRVVGVEQAGERLGLGEDVVGEGVGVHRAQSSRRRSPAWAT